MEIKFFQQLYLAELCIIKAPVHEGHLKIFAPGHYLSDIPVLAGAMQKGTK